MRSHLKTSFCIFFLFKMCFFFGQNRSDPNRCRWSKRQFKPAIKHLVHRIIARNHSMQCSASTKRFRTGWTSLMCHYPCLGECFSSHLGRFGFQKKCTPHRRFLIKIWHHKFLKSKLWGKVFPRDWAKLFFSIWYIFYKKKYQGYRLDISL